jgi:hypothetical protein
MMELGIKNFDVRTPIMIKSSPHEIFRHQDSDLSIQILELGIPFD